MKKYLLIMFTCMGIMTAHAQDSLTQRKNSIKLDITSHLLYRNAFIVAYERVMSPHQTLVLSAGYQEFPKALHLGQRIGVKRDNERRGYKFGADYRFYLRKENKYLAPRGVYIGPYLTYHRFRNNRDLTFETDASTQNVTLDSKFTIFNVGFQVGYQFLIANRWAIDLSFIGPSLSKYKYTLDLEGNSTIDKDEITNELILDLLDRFPLLDDVVSEGEVTRKGKLDTWSFGYRYQLTVGYHFGRKKIKS